MFIALTQFLFLYCILLPVYHYAGITPNIQGVNFILLVISSVFIAAGGYIINDYFDIRIDEINKPSQLIVGRIIPGRTAIKWHLLLTTLGSLLGFYLAFRVRVLSFGLIFPFTGVLLWFYSAKYKRMLFWGNFIVAFLSALVVLIVYMYEFFWLRLHPDFFADLAPDLKGMPG